MKFLFAIELLILSICSTPVINNHADIQFNVVEYDFEIIPYNKEVGYSFKFYNPCKTPLIVTDVKASCGCTNVNWNRAPVKQDKSGIIRVGYDAAFPGKFHKEIKVYYNGPDSPVTLQIKGQVEYPE